MLPPSRKRDEIRQPNDAELKYVAVLYHGIDQGVIPDEDHFRLMASRSLNVKDKFSLLQDVREAKFHDLIVQIAREPYDLGDKLTLYVSDYTENTQFFNYTWDGVRDLASGEADTWGYTSRRQSTKNQDWVGPYGKRAMQVTCYEPHASYIRQEAKTGSWISLRNVQIKFGRNDANLEGFMRDEQRSGSFKMNAEVLRTDDAENIDPRLKKAIRRCRDYNKEKKADLKRLKSNEGSKKRKHDDQDTRNLNSRQRRKAKRADVDRVELQSQEALGLNDLISSESANRRISSVESILQPVFYETTIAQERVTMQLPFTCAKYRASVRVIDFKPNRLEDFACSRMQSQYACLSDNSEAESSSSEDEDIQDMSHGQMIWEWRFALLLEDATPSKGRNKEDNRVWVIVDNSSAQYLTGLDASK
jgi:hypothetical protein